MIARISLLIILAALLPDFYIYCRYLRHRPGLSLWARILWWLPSIALLSMTLAYSSLHNFAPSNLTWFNVYLFMLGIAVLPKLLFMLCSLAGTALMRVFGWKRNWGNYAGLLLVLAQFYILIAGSMSGPDKLRIKQVTIAFDDLPAAFDGYRIAMFSDAHLGSMKEELLQRVVSDINSQAPDMVVFAGDLQNMRPHELVKHAPTLIHLHADDGIYSVLGNHDYATYVKVDDSVKTEYESMTRKFEYSINWDLLLNERRIIRRGNDSIVIAGEENDGQPPFPSHANLRKTLHGISPHSFVIMLQHDPSAWRRSILPGCNAQLTLSGHTHGGQFSLFGLRPTKFKYSEDDGLYHEGKRCLYVSTGIGGLVPFRFNMPPEVVVITLKKK